MSHIGVLVITVLIGVTGVVSDDVDTRTLITTFTTLPTSCAEAHFLAGSKAKNGIYQIQVPDFDMKPFFVYCLKDPNGGPAWTVVQRRQNGNINFLRNWSQYKMGFGNLNSEFNIGMDKLHAMTNSQVNELWIQLEDFEGEKRYAKYESFAIGDEKAKYALNVLGAYSGDAGDSLTNIHEGQAFSTIDQINTESGRDCVKEFKGAWWHKSCHSSNLNGLYLKGTTDIFAQGVDWYHWRGHYYSLKYAHMAIRPAN